MISPEATLRLIEALESIAVSLEKIVRPVQVVAAVTASTPIPPALEADTKK